MWAEGVAQPHLKVKKGTLLMIENHLQKFLGFWPMMLVMESGFQALQASTQSLKFLTLAIQESTSWDKIEKVSRKILDKYLSELLKSLHNYLCRQAHEYSILEWISSWLSTKRDAWSLMPSTQLMCFFILSECQTPTMKLHARGVATGVRHRWRHSW